MKLTQLGKVVFKAIADAVLIKVVAEQLFLLAFVTGFGHPWCFIEHHRLQFLILLETAHERGLRASFALPQFNRRLDARRQVEKMGGEAVGIEGCSLADGVVLAGLRHRRQGLNHQPSGVVGIFHREVGLSFTGNRGEVDGLCARSVLCKRYGVDDQLAIRQDGKVVLFAVAEAIARCRHAADEQRLVGQTRRRCIDVEADAGCLACLHAERAALRVDHLFGFGIDELNESRALYGLLTRVEDAGGELALVALSHEARHIGLNHHILLGDDLALQRSVAHLLVGGQCHETPSGDALGQCELHRYITIFVGDELWIEEGSLVQVLAHLSAFSSFSAFAGIALGQSGDRTHESLIFTFNVKSSDGSLRKSIGSDQHLLDSRGIDGG